MRLQTGDLAPPHRGVYRPDGRLLAKGTGGGKLCVWGLLNPQDTLATSFSSDQGSVWSVRFIPDVARLAYHPAGTGRSGRRFFHSFGQGDVQRSFGIGVYSRSLAVLPREPR